MSDLAQRALSGIASGVEQTSSTGKLVLVVLTVGVAFYIYRSYSKMGKAARSKVWGLPRGERIVHEIFGEANIQISKGERVATAALGVAVGALLGQVAVATVHAPGVNFALTSADRLLVRVWRDDKHFEQREFQRGQATVRPIGPGSRHVNGGPSVVLRVEARDGSAPIEALIHEGYLSLFANWAA